MATNPEQKADQAKPEAKKPKAERQAKVSKLTSRGQEYIAVVAEPGRRLEAREGPRL